MEEKKGRKERWREGGKWENYKQLEKKIDRSKCS